MATYKIEGNTKISAEFLKTHGWSYFAHGSFWTKDCALPAGIVGFEAAKMLCGNRLQCRIVEITAPGCSREVWASKTYVAPVEKVMSAAEYKKLMAEIHDEMHG